MLVFQCTCNYYNGFIHDFYEFSINYFSNIVIRNHLILGLGEQWGKIGRNSLRLSLFKSRMNYLNLRLESTLGQILLRIKSIYTSSLLNLEPAFSVLCSTFPGNFAENVGWLSSGHHNKSSIWHLNNENFLR